MQMSKIVAGKLALGIFRLSFSLSSPFDGAMTQKFSASVPSFHYFFID